MKMTRFDEPQILAILRQAEGGVPVAELCREHGMSTASFYKWRAKYAGVALTNGDKNDHPVFLTLSVPRGRCPHQ